MSDKYWEKVGGVVLFVCGLMLGVVGFAEPIGPPWNTLAFLSMFPLMAFGVYILARD